MNHRFSHPARLFFLALAIAACTPCTFADSPVQSNSTDAPPPLPVLEGNVQKITLDLDQLRDVGLDLKHLVKAISSLYDEVTCQPMTMISEPEMVGPVIVSIPTIAVPAGPPQPARKPRVDLAMSSIKPAIDMMKSNVDKFVSGQAKFDLSDQTAARLQPLFDEWVTGVKDLYTKEVALEGMTQGPPYDNYKIADQTMAMEKEIKKLDESRHGIFKIIRSEGESMIHQERKEERHAK